MPRAMAPRKKAAKRAPKRKTPARKTTKKAAKRKVAKKTTKRTTAKKPATRKVAKKTARKATKTAAPKAAPKAAAATSRPKTVKWTTRKAGVFTHLDLADHLMAWNPDLTKKQAKTVVEDSLATLQTAIKKTGKVRLKGIGTITTKKIPARKGGKKVKNPFTGEMVKQKPKPASVKVKISAAKEIKS